MVNNLYDNKTYFKLISGNRFVMIDEPINWDKADITVPRDTDYWGFSAEFISADISLQWPDSDAIAFNFIKDIYDANYGDGVVVLEFGIYDSKVEKWQFRGNLNLNTYVKEYINGQFVITCTVSRLSFEDLLRTRFETDIDFSKTVTLDNKPIIPPTALPVLLHSKKITKEFKSYTTEPRDTNSQSPDLNMARYMNIQLDVSDGQVAELEGGQGLPLSLSGIDPRDSDLFCFQAAEAGSYDISFKAAFHLIIRRDSPISDVGTYYCVPRMMIRRGGTVIEYTEFNQFKVSGTSGNYLVEFDFACDIQHLKRDLQVNDELFLDFTGTMQHTGTKYIYFVTNYTSTTDIISETVADETVVNHYRAMEALTKMVEYITGVPNAVVSTEFSIGGQIWQSFITNGYGVRNFDPADKPVITNLKAFFESYFPVYGLGYSVRNFGGVDILVIEKIQFFFNNKLIKKLESTYDYREEHAKDKTYNEYEIGYAKYPDSDTNTLDEYNTYQTGLFPIKTYKAKFSKKVNYISSGYLYETQRREQFKKNPSESMTNDDDIFMLCVVEDRVSYSTEFDAESSGPTLNTQKDLNANVGTVLRCDRGGGNNFNQGKTWTILSITAESDGTFTYGLNAPIIDEAGLGVFSHVYNGIRAERNEMFNAIEGILSPDTAYNLRITPRRMLYNWAPVLNIGLTKKGDDELIQNTFMKNNSHLVARLDPDDPFSGYDLADYVRESDDISMYNFRRDIRVALHEPKYVYFKSDMAYDEFIYIRDRLTGQAQSSTDNGYIVHADADGNYWKSFIYSIKYTPSSGVAEIQGAKYKIY